MKAAAGHDQLKMALMIGLLLLLLGVSELPVGSSQAICNEATLPNDWYPAVTSSLDDLESRTGQQSNMELYNSFPVGNPYVYGYAKCTGINAEDCFNCIRDTSVDIKENCKYAQGGQEQRNNCFVRYERDPFTA